MDGYNEEMETKDLCPDPAVSAWSYNASKQDSICFASPQHSKSASLPVCKALGRVRAASLQTALLPAGESSNPEEQNKNKFMEVTSI